MKPVTLRPDLERPSRLHFKAALHHNTSNGNSQGKASRHDAVAASQGHPFGFLTGLVRGRAQRQSTRLNTTFGIRLSMRFIITYANEVKVDGLSPS